MIEKLRQKIQELISVYETEKQERMRLESELEKTTAQNNAYKEQNQIFYSSSHYVVTTYIINSYR